MYKNLIDQISALLCQEYGYTMIYSRNLDMHLPMRVSDEKKTLSRHVNFICRELSDDCMWLGASGIYLFFDRSEEYVSQMVMTYYVSSDKEIIHISNNKEFAGRSISYGNKDLYIAISLITALMAENSDNYHIVYEVYSFILIQEFLFKINSEPGYYIFISDIIDFIMKTHAEHITEKESNVLPQEREDEQRIVDLLLKTEKNMLSRDEVLDAIESTRADGSWGIGTLYFRFLQKNLITAEELEQYDTCIHRAECAAHIFRKSLDLYPYPTQLTGILEDFYSSLK